MSLNTSKNQGEDGIISQISKVNSLVQGGNINHIALASEVMETMKRKLTSITASSTNTLQRIESTLSHIYSLIPDGFELEASSMTLEGKHGTTELSPIGSNCIISIGGDSFSISLSKNEEMVCTVLLQNGGSIDVQVENKDQLTPILSTLNRKLSHYGICVYINDQNKCTLGNSQLLEIKKPKKRKKQKKVKKTYDGRDISQLPKQYKTFTISDFEVTVIGTSGSEEKGSYRIFVKPLGADSETAVIHKITNSDFELLRLLIDNRGKPQKVLGYKRTRGLPKLYEVFGKETIKNLHGKGYYIGELHSDYQKKHPRVRARSNNKPKTPNISTKTRVPGKKQGARTPTKKSVSSQKTQKRNIQELYLSDRAVKQAERRRARDRGSEIARKVINETDENLGQDIINMFLENPGEFFTDKDIYEIFGNDTKVLSSFLLKKASFNRVGTQGEIIEYTKKCWFLLNHDVITQTSKQKALCESEARKSEKLILLDEYNCILLDNYNIFLQPLTLQGIKISHGKLSIKPGPKKRLTTETVRRAVINHGLEAFILVDQAGNVINGDRGAEKTKRAIRFEKVE